MLAAFGIILQHYNNPSIGGAIRVVQPMSPNATVLGILQVAMICAVDLFILISGYFMRDSKKRDLLKPVKLLSMLVVFELAFYIIQEPLQGKPFSFEGLLRYFTPNYWFVFVYISLYLISPFINLAWERLSRKNRKNLIVILLVLFSFLPIITEMIGAFTGSSLHGVSTIGLDGSQSGYTIVNFVLMYLIGCWLHDRDEELDHKDMKPVSIILLFIPIPLVLFAMLIFEKRFIGGDPTVLVIAYRYQNPLVIAEAVLYFLFFKQIKLKNSRIINSFAAAAFPSYLIHINLFRYCGIEEAVLRPMPLLLAHVFGCIIGIYLISWVIYTVYSFVTRPLFSMIDRKWKHNRFYTAE